MHELTNPDPATDPIPNHTHVYTNPQLDLVDTVTDSRQWQTDIAVANLVLVFGGMPLILTLT